VAAVGLEGDLHAHRVAGEHGALDLCVVEHGGEIVGQVWDRDPARIPGWGRAAVASIVRVNESASDELPAQVPPHIAVAADTVT
jgi:hypothetical protein